MRGAKRKTLLEESHDKSCFSFTISLLGDTADVVVGDLGTKTKLNIFCVKTEAGF